MKLKPWIARRYLFSRRVGGFGPLLTTVAIASIAIGMLSLIVIMSVMRGFKKDLSERLMGINAHITVTATQNGVEPLALNQLQSILEGLPVQDMSQFVQGEVIAKSKTTGDLIAQGARVRGVDPSRMDVTKVMKYRFPEGTENIEEALDIDEETGHPGSIIGSEMIMQLVVHPSFHDTLELIAPLADIGPTGDLMPSRKRFTVSGIFKAGIYDYDTKYIFTSLEAASGLLGQQAEEGWSIRLEDADDVPTVLDKLRNSLPEGWNAKGWHEQNKKLFAALKLERIAMGAILVMVLLIASFAIAGVILLITAAKRKDIAILQSIGMKRKDISSVFTYNAAFIGGLGSAIGLVSGLAVCLVLERWPIKLPSSYYLDYLPVDLNLLVAIGFSLMGIVVAVLASLYPVRQVTRLNIVDVLRYE